MTESVSETPLAEVPKPEPKPNSFQRIVGVLTAPDETFRSIVRRPDWLIPLLIILVLAVTSAVLLVPRIDIATSMQEQAEAQNRPIDPQAMKFVTAFFKIAMYASPVISVAMIAIIAMLLLVAFRIFGGEGEFSQAFSIVLYSWMPQLIRSILACTVLLQKPSFTFTQAAEPIRSNLSFLFSMKTQPLLFALFGSLDIFTLWTLFLLVVGFARMSRFSKAKSAAIVLTMWICMTALKLIGPAFAQMKAGKD